MQDIAKADTTELKTLRQRLSQRQAGASRIRLPVAMIGPGDGDEGLCQQAEDIAAMLAGAGMQIVCGGRGGVMQAASRGAARVGGVAIGLLPEEDARAANPYLTVVIPTGMGEMRNAVIARSAICLVAVGGGAGTVSEMALGVKWGKPVYALETGLLLDGVMHCHDTEEILREAMQFLLAYEDPWQTTRANAAA